MGPDFLVIGAMKCGTSTVCAFLEDHPGVFMVPGAEPNFFSDDAQFARGRDWYEGHFEGAGGRPCGEGSNAYANTLRHPQAAARIAALYPGVRIVYMVRHPLDRIGSAWVQNRQDSGDRFPPTLDAAVRAHRDLYLGQSLYGRTLAAYRAHFPDDRIFLGFLEDLKADRAAFFARLTGFLGVAPMAEVRRGHQNPTAGKRVVTPLYSRVNRLPMAGALKRALPGGLKRAVRDRLLSRPVTALPRLSPALAAEIVPEIRADAADFLARAGKPADFWTFAP